MAAKKSETIQYQSPPGNVFQQAVSKAPEIQNCYQHGLQALERQHRRLIQVSDLQQLQGSVDIDGCLSKQKLYTQEHRWDYALGYQDTVHFIEVHSAQTSEVTTVLDKLKWLKDWLNAQAPELNRLQSQYHWIASGRFNILKTSSQYRELARKGLIPRRQLEL